MFYKFFSKSEQAEILKATSSLQLPWWNFFVAQMVSGQKLYLHKYEPCTDCLAPINWFSPRHSHRRTIRGIPWLLPVCIACAIKLPEPDLLFCIPEIRPYSLRHDIECFMQTLQYGK
jgi:hypothetical protein